MVRAKPDGTTLSWATFGIEQYDDFSFFIEWGTGTVHPPASSPTSCQLQSFQIITPDDEALDRLNSALQLEVKVSKGTEPHLQLTIDTPRGKVTF